MQIKNIEGLSAHDLQQQVEQGGRFVYFLYTFSLLFITFRRTSGVYLVRPGEGMARAGIIGTVVSFIFGWWGIPWGPKYTIEAMRTNLRGGKDVTDEVTAVIAGHVLFDETTRLKKA